ncbi:MAG: hypothetical protein H6728_17420 [Myxococcales bacterium]|nr:hypothetical protein [Myxococcales bacterium]MCB9644854.1 hypothetical protein [Myxococcales bacterium]
MNAPTTPQTKPRSKGRWILLGLLLLGITTMIWWKAWWPKPLSSFAKELPRPLLLGHRGAAGEAPENSMLAFAAALAGGANGVELDVMMTSDRHLVVFHDLKLQKRLPLKGAIRKLTLQELRKIDLSIYFQMRTKKPVPPPFQKTYAPLLEDVLQYYQKYPKAVLNIEMKNEDVLDKGHERETYKLIQRYSMEDRVIVSSFNPFSMWRFRQIAPQIPRGLIYDKTLAFYLRDLWLLSVARPDALHPNFRIVNEAYMKWARKQGFAVNVWTVNAPEDMRRMIRLGVDAIITDFPQRLLQIAKEERARKPK